MTLITVAATINLVMQHLIKVRDLALLVISAALRTFLETSLARFLGHLWGALAVEGEPVEICALKWRLNLKRPSVV